MCSHGEGGAKIQKTREPNYLKEVNNAGFFWGGGVGAGKMVTFPLKS